MPKEKRGDYVGGRHRLTPGTPGPAPRPDSARRRPQPRPRPTASDRVETGRHSVDTAPPSENVALLAEEAYDLDYSAGTDDLGNKAVRGASATIGGQALRVLLQFATLIALSRLLTPGDYGLVAEIIAIVGVGEVLRDFGLSSAAMQATRVTAAQRSNLFWINTGVGAALGIGAFLLAPALVDLYSDPELLQPARVIAVTFLLNGMAAQFQADLNRKLKYGRVVLSDVGSQAVAFAVAIALALDGAGYWALVAQQVVQAGTALVIVVGADDWRPGWPQRKAGMRSFWNYGLSLMGTQLLGYLTRNVDSVVIGYRFGASALGFYERAFQVLMLPLNQINAPITRVALPVLARLQHSADEFRSYLFRGQLVLTNATVGVFAVGAALSEPLFGLVFGSRWEASVPIFQVLAIGGVFTAVAYPAYWAFLALGLTRANLYCALLTRPLVAVGIVVGSNWGVIGVAWGYTLGLFTVWPVEMWFINRNSMISGRSLFWQGLRPLMSWVVVAAPAYLLIRLTDQTYVQSLGYGALVFAASFLAVFALVPNFRREIKEVLATLRMMRRPTATVPASPDSAPQATAP